MARTEDVDHANVTRYRPLRQIIDGRLGGLISVRTANASITVQTAVGKECVSTGVENMNVRNVVGQQFASTGANAIAA